MYLLNGSQAFWIFIAVEFGFLASAVISAWLVSPKKPNEKKKTIFECGQDPFGDARSFRIMGISKYFGYAVAFFALDAFAWVILTSALTMKITPDVISIITIYTAVIFAGIGYFLVEKKNLVG